MSRKNVIRIIWPPLLLYLVVTLVGVYMRITNSWDGIWARFWKALNCFVPDYAFWGVNWGISHLHMFYPSKLYFALALLSVLLAFWYWKPNWFTGLLLVVPFYLLGPHTGLLIPVWAGVL